MHKPPQVYLIRSEPALILLKEWIERNFSDGPIMLVRILSELWAIAHPDGRLIDRVQIRRVGHKFRFEETD